MTFKPTASNGDVSRVVVRYSAIPPGQFSIGTGGQFSIGANITGIRTNKDQNAAIADYTLKRVNVTPFASDNQELPKGSQAQLTLYDDGWRVD